MSVARAVAVGTNEKGVAGPQRWLKSQATSAKPIIWLPLLSNAASGLFVW